MKKFFAVYIGLIMVFSGCIIKPISESPKLGNLQLINQSQDAVIMIATGWTGGMGSMPVLDEKGDVMIWNGLPIYFDQSQLENVKLKLPTCFIGSPEIKVSANIMLVQKSSVNSSLLEPEEQSYFEAKVNKLYNIEVKAEECVD